MVARKGDCELCASGEDGQAFAGVNMTRFVVIDFSPQKSEHKISDIYPTSADADEVTMMGPLARPDHSRPLRKGRL